MSDDLVKRLRDWEHVWPEDESEPEGDLYIAAADRIEQLVATNEELEAELHLMKTSGVVEVAVRNPSVMEYMQHWEGRAERAEVKLAKAVDVIEWALIAWDDHCKHGYNMQGDWVHDARTTLAELTGGQKDE